MLLCKIHDSVLLRKVDHKLLVDVFLVSVSQQSVILEIVKDLLRTLVVIAHDFLLLLSFRRALREW